MKFGSPFLFSEVLYHVLLQPFSKNETCQVFPYFTCSELAKHVWSPKFTFVSFKSNHYLILSNPSFINTIFICTMQGKLHLHFFLYYDIFFQNKLKYTFKNIFSKCTDNGHILGELFFFIVLLLLSSEIYLAIPCLRSGGLK